MLKFSKNRVFYEKNILPLYEDVYKFVYSRVKDKTLAQDVTQNTMEKAWSKLHQLKDRHKVRQWLFEISNNEVKLLWRKQDRDYKIIFLDDYKQNFDINKMIDLQSDVLNKLIKEEEMLLLMKALDMIDDDYKELILLWADNKMSEKDMSLIMGINYNTFRSRLYRGINKLKDIYIKLEEGDSDE